MPKTHGKSKDPAYRCWLTMRNRCNNDRATDWQYYGGRGIAVCAQWDDFEVFLADMGPRPPGHTIERKDSDGDYEPSNCVWATRERQSRNRKYVRLSEQDAADIRTAYAPGVLTYDQLAEHYDVAPSTIAAVVREETWK